MTELEAINEAKRIIDDEANCLGCGSTYDQCGGRDKIPRRAQIAIVNEIERLKRISGKLAEIAKQFAKP